MSAPNSLEKAVMEAFQRGAAGEAEALLRKALDVDHRDYKCLVMLSHVLRSTGQADEAAGMAEKAIALRPTVVDAYYQSGLSLLALGRSGQALTALRKAVELRPEVGEFHFYLGHAYEALSQFADAEKCFGRALRLEPRNLAARLSLATLRLNQGDFEGALKHGEQAVKLDPNSVQANLTMAEIYHAESDWRSAEPFVRQTLKIEPNNALALCYLGMRLTQLGQFEEADREFARSIQANPTQGLTYLHRTQSRKITSADAALISEMEALLDSGALKGIPLSDLHFALAKSYDNLGDYERAMAAYDEANRLALETRFGVSPDYDFSSLPGLESPEFLREQFPAEAVRKGIPGASESDLPVFVTGMIRSGTTLTERILSSHPAVSAGGELTFWGHAAGNREAMQALREDAAKATAVGEEYLSLLRKLAPGAKRVTDKLPGNYQRLGLLLEFFPNARVIHCRRSPIDTAVSIYMTPNGAAVAPMMTKSGIVHMLKHYLAVMEYWREVLPKDRFFEVQYEDLVSDPETTIRRLVEFCGLEWDAACLHPEENAGDVRTPSFWQVRQPIFRTSVERWRRYEPWLGELAELVELEG